jgi:acetyl-CoA carboxylase biotin carboxyl carrier protein
MDLKEIKKLIQMVEESKISHLSVEEDGHRIEIDKESEAIMSPQMYSPMPPMSQPIASSPAGVNSTKSGAKQEPVLKEDDGLVAIKAQMVGTFYSSPNPDSPPYVQVGDTIQKGQVVCILEAMKLFNEIVSEQSGKLVECCVEPGEPVEYGQDLFLIKP